MRRFTARVITTSLAALALLFGSSLNLKADDNPYQNDYRGRVVRLSLVEGDVSIQHGPNDPWLDATINAPLLQGDRLWVGAQGRVEIEWDDGSYVRLASNSVLEIQNLELSSNGRYTQVFLRQGLAYFNIPESYSDTFRVTTPSMAADAYHAARFRLTVDGQNQLTVFRGEVRANSRAGDVNIRRGEIFTLPADNTERYYLGSAPGRDDWDRWNLDRDDYLVRASSYRYLPSNVSYGAYDLDRNGHWAYQSGYGYVWAPYNVAADWVPYSYGRWAYYPTFGYSWISYEPWGWLPYHYGRWAWISGFGWGWWPGTSFAYWSPGTVFFFHHGPFLGWVPISPFDPFTTGTFININVFRPRNFFGNRVVIVNNNTFINNVVRQDTIIRNREVLTEITSSNNLSFGARPQVERTANSEILRPSSFTQSGGARLVSDTKGWGREDGIRGTGARPSGEVITRQAFGQTADRNANVLSNREGLRTGATSGGTFSNKGQENAGRGRESINANSPNSGTSSRSESLARPQGNTTGQENKNSVGRDEGRSRETVRGNPSPAPYSSERNQAQGRAEGSYAPSSPQSYGSRNESLRQQNPQSPPSYSTPRTESYRASPPPGEIRGESRPSYSPPPVQRNEGRMNAAPNREPQRESKPNTDKPAEKRNESRSPSNQSSYYMPRESAPPSYSGERSNNYSPQNSYRSAPAAPPAQSRSEYRSSYQAPQERYSTPSYSAPAPRYEAPQRSVPRYESPRYEAPRYEAPRQTYSPPAMPRQEFSRPTYSAPSYHPAPAPSFRSAPAPRVESRPSGSGHSSSAPQGRRRE